MARTPSTPSATQLRTVTTAGRLLVGIGLCLWLLLWPVTPMAQPAAVQPQVPAASGQALPAGPIGDPAGLAALLRDDARRAELLRTLDALAKLAASQPAPASPVPVAGEPAAADLGQTPQAEPAPAAPRPATAAEAPTAPPEAPPLPLVPDSVGARVVQQAADTFDQTSDFVQNAVRTATDLSGIQRWVLSVWNNPWLRERVIATAWKVTAMLLAALAAQFLVHRLLRSTRARLQQGGPLSWPRRLPRGGLVLLLELLPLAAAYLAGTVALTLLEPVLTTRVIGQSLLNALILSGAVMRLARFVLSPLAPRLRLVTMAEEQVASLLRTLKGAVGLGVFGLVAMDAALLFGLDWITHGVLMRVLIGIVALQLVLLVLRMRVLIASAIEPEPGAEGFWAVFRNRVALTWHVLAILYIVAAYLVWALAIQDGFVWLLTRTLMTIGLTVAARLAEAAIERGTASATAEAKSIDALRNPALARLARHLPLVSRLALATVRIGVVVVLIEIWGLGSFAWFDEGRLGRQLAQAVGSIGTTLLIALLVWEAVNAGIERRLELLARDAQAARSARARTLLPMMRTFLGILIFVSASLVVLSEIGVNIAPLLAGAGVIGLAIGFGSQTLVRDVITGAFLLFEDAMAVGDVVTVAGVGGVVEALSIRTIKLRSVDGSVHYIPFSAVSTVTNQTKDYSYAVLDISVAYKEHTDTVVDVMKQVGNDMRAEDRWAAVIREPLDVWGIETLGDSGVSIRARFKTDPGARWAVAREYRRRIKMAFDLAAIEIPYPHQKVVYEGVAPAAPLPQPVD